MIEMVVRVAKKRADERVGGTRSRREEEELSDGATKRAKEEEGTVPTSEGRTRRGRRWMVAGGV